MKRCTVIGAALLVIGFGLAAREVSAADTQKGSNNTNNPAAANSPQSANTATGASQMSQADKTFLIDASRGSMAEMDFGQIAADHGGTPDVIKFGQQMVTDHTRLNNELKQLAAKKDVVLPQELDSKDKMVRDKLLQASQRTGVEFDRDYMHRMVQDHEKDVDLFQREIKNGKDPDVQSWASRTLPTLQEHLRNARTINDSIKKKQTAKR